VSSDRLPEERRIPPAERAGRFQSSFQYFLRGALAFLYPPRSNRRTNLAPLVSKVAISRRFPNSLAPLIPAKFVGEIFNANADRLSVETTGEKNVISRAKPERKKLWL
jgi:hypothetical protein